MRGEDAIVKRLKRYRPASPPAELRRRVLASSAERRLATMLRTWPLSLAALVLIGVLRVLTFSASADLDARVGAFANGHERLVDDLTRRLGGDALARVQAEALVAADEEHHDE
jgi:hypothetical protein